MRFFNTAGPVRPEKRYCIPTLERLDMDEALRLVRDEKYFMLRAPSMTSDAPLILFADISLARSCRKMWRMVHPHPYFGTARSDKS